MGPKDINQKVEELQSIWEVINNFIFVTFKWAALEDNDNEVPITTSDDSEVEGHCLGRLKANSSATWESEPNDQ